MFSLYKFSIKLLLCALGPLCLSLPGAQASETLLHSFSNSYLSGANPVGQLASYNGQFYGVTYRGVNGYGSIFRLSSSGVITNLHEFSGADGSHPMSGMVQINGTLYGTTVLGGSIGVGALYKISTNGFGFTVLHSFAGYNYSNPSASDGATVKSALTLASDGKLYGVTVYGGAYQQGTLFSFDPASNAYTVLHAFSRGTDTGGGPAGAVAEGTDGALYGVFYNDYDTLYQGGIFRINKDGSGCTRIHTFADDGSDPAGRAPLSDLIRASDGNLYGTCWAGGQHGYGAVYKVVTSRPSVTPVWAFDSTTGVSPTSVFGQDIFQYRLLQGSDGRLYGVTQAGGSNGFGTAFALTLSGTCSVLANLNYTDAFGTANPLAPSGTGFLSTSYQGGEFTTSYDAPGYGSAFTISATGILRVTQNFYQQDGAYPSGPLTQIASSLIIRANFYGECSGGGEYGDGIIYVTGQNNGYTILHHLNNNLQEGSAPVGGLLLARDGKLYGMCFSGGQYGYGTIFQVTTKGVYKVIHHFQASEGQYPINALVQGAYPDNNLYGTLMTGEVNSNGCLFSTDTTGANFQVIHVFSGSGGSQPECTPFLLNGYLIGTCSSGGYYGLGTLWSCKTDGTGFGDYFSFDGSFGEIPYYAGALSYRYASSVQQYVEGTAFAGGEYNQGTIYAENIMRPGASAVHAFNNNFGEGSGPIGGILYDRTSGNYYGCCLNGGINSKGTLYAYNRPSGVLTVLQAFGGSGDGATPSYCPVLGVDGYLYGVTGFGGAYGYGVIYKHTTTP